MNASAPRPTIAYAPAPDGYRPGACNIGPAEIRHRRIAAVAAVVGTAAIAAGLVVVDVGPLGRLLLAVPLGGAAATVYQAVARFCIGFGMAGLANFGPVGRQARIADDAARRADRAKALRAIVGSGVFGLAGGVVFALLPLG